MATKTRPNSNIFFLDWDNTLFGTDYLTKMHYRQFISLDEEIERDIIECEKVFPLNSN